MKWWRRRESNPNPTISPSGQVRAISGQIESQVGQPARHRQEADVDQRTAIDLDKPSSGRESYLRGTQYKHNEMEVPEDLRTVIQTWDSLPEAIRAGIIAMCVEVTRGSL